MTTGSTPWLPWKPGCDLAVFFSICGNESWLLLQSTSTPQARDTRDSKAGRPLQGRWPLRTHLLLSDCRVARASDSLLLFVRLSLFILFPGPCSWWGHFGTCVHILEVSFLSQEAGTAVATMVFLQQKLLRVFLLHFTSLQQKCIKHLLHAWFGPAHWRTGKE